MTKVMVSDPAAIRELWEGFYQSQPELAGLEVEMPTFSQELVESMMVRAIPRVLIFVHSELLTLPVSRWFPRIRDVSYGPLSRIKTQEIHGWMFVESDQRAPYQNIDLERLLERFTQEGSVGLTISAYAIFAQFCRLVFGSYPDTNSWTRLTGSWVRQQGDVDAGFHSAELHVCDNLGPDSSMIGLGARSATLA